MDENEGMADGRADRLHRGTGGCRMGQVVVLRTQLRRERKLSDVHLMLRLSDIRGQHHEDFNQLDTSTLNMTLISKLQDAIKAVAPTRV